MAIALRKQDLVVPTDNERRAREHALSDPAQHGLIEVRRVDRSLGGWINPGAQRWGHALHKQQEGGYDQTPGIRRLQEGQRPSLPTRCRLMT